MKFASTILSLLLIIVVGGQPGRAAENDELSNQYVRTIYDWEITITARKLDHFLAYKGSKLAPVYDLTASYQNFSQAYAGPSAPIKYRQFLCGAFRVLGCKTYNALNLAPVTQGIIRVCDDSGAANNCPWGVSSVIARLIVDLGLRRVTVDRIILPAPMVDSVASDMAHYGFYTYPEQANRPVVAHILLTLVSDPGGIERALYFNGF